MYSTEGNWRQTYSILIGFGESKFVFSYPYSCHPRMEKVMKTKKVLNLKFYCDPGHGWIAVKVSLLRELGITGQISGCSFVKGGTAYLEEDCDAERLIRALDAKGIAYKVEVKHTLFETISVGTLIKNKHYSLLSTCLV